MEADFVRYLDAFAPFLYAALANHEEYALCSIAVGLIGDICRALQEASLPYCDTFMNMLLQMLQVISSISLRFLKENYFLLSLFNIDLDFIL